MYDYGLSLVGRVIYTFGNQAQKKKYYIPRILKLEDWWCQGFSEPGAGSDFASLKTRAVRDGDHYIVMVRRPGPRRRTAPIGFSAWSGPNSIPMQRSSRVFLLLVDTKSPQEKMAELEVQLKALEMTWLRVMANASKRRSGTQDPATSILKLKGSEIQQATAELELGLLALPFSEEYEGFAGGAVETMIVMEAFGKALILEPYFATVVLAWRHPSSWSERGAEGEVHLRNRGRPDQIRLRLRRAAGTLRPPRR
ncbi:hypothetical protein PMN64_34185 [Bradyrhizobium sp. UFLA01-814]